ncbi:MAG: VWA domain-containing protein [Gammaproteobacteria bacterium]|nr:VWA domain-containing protein [Gammaproteobacteria bacterium]
MENPSGWNMDAVPASVTVNSMRKAELAFNVTLPEARGEENIITFTATSQSEPDIQAVARIRVGVMEAEVINPRGDEKSDLMLILDNSAAMGRELLAVSDALEDFLGVKNEDSLAPIEDPVLEDGMEKPFEEEPRFTDDSPNIELVTFKDSVTSRIVTKNVGSVIARIRSLQPSGGGTCPNASVVALEFALEHINVGGQIVLATASSPHKDAAAVIAQLRDKDIKVHVLLAGACDDDIETDKALYKGIADGTEGTFNWMPRGKPLNEANEAMEEVVTEAVTAVMEAEIIRTLTLTIAGEGQIVEESNGLVCDSDCSAKYANGKTPTFTAVADAGWLFVNWDGDCSSDGRVTMDDNRACTANFVGPGHDSDADGVDDIIEHAVSNNGDGNSDGTADRLQAQIVSLPDAADNGDYLTLEIDTPDCIPGNVRVETEEVLPEQDKFCNNVCR